MGVEEAGGLGSNLFSGVKGRFLRSIVSLALGIAIAKWQNNQWYISATPLLSTTGKWLRDNYPGQWEWLPF